MATVIPEAGVRPPLRQPVHARARARHAGLPWLQEMTDLASDDSAQVAAFRSRVYGLLLALMRDPGPADDLTQETLRRAVTHLDQSRDAHAALAWLYRIATTIAVDHARGAHRAVTLVDPDRFEEGSSARPGGAAAA